MLRAHQSLEKKIIYFIKNKLEIKNGFKNSILKIENNHE